MPAITLGGNDVTAQLQGGSLGAQIALRDPTLPTLQANLDEFAQTLSTRFAAQGLTLFTDAAGAVPAGGGVPAAGGLSRLCVGRSRSTRRCWPTPVAGARRHQRDRRIGRPGPVGFTPNPPGGPAGFNTLITRVLDFALGAEAQAGRGAAAAGDQRASAPTGTLAAGFAAPGRPGGAGERRGGAGGADQRRRHQPARHRAGRADRRCRASSPPAAR